jgi:hypothetical protein
MDLKFIENSGFTATNASGLNKMFKKGISMDMENNSKQIDNILNITFKNAYVL